MRRVLPFGHVESGQRDAMTARLPSARRRAVVTVLAGLFVGGAGLGAVVLGGLALAERTQRRSVQAVAAPHLGCPPGDIQVTFVSAGDTDEHYRVEGCGKRGRLLCAAQDPACGFVPE